MHADPTQLLRQLEPLVRPVPHGASSPAAPLEGRSFEELLAQAQRGEVLSGRSVTVAFESTTALNEQQLARVSAAADLAEASGAQRALMLIDGRGLVLDVASRALSGELSGGPPIIQTDTVVYVPGESDRPAPPLGLSRGIPPRGAAEQITRAHPPGTVDTG